MKYLIASDIHGSYYYTKKIVDAYKLHHCNQLLLIGDILYHGPRNDLPKDYAPKKVIPLLNDLKNQIVCCRGNCDAEVDQMVLDFKITSDYEVIKEKGYNIIITHGHVYSPEHLPPHQKGDVIIYGHIHIPKMYYDKEVYILNPGSISIPKENTAHSYATLENKVFTLYDDNHQVLKTFELKND